MKGKAALLVVDVQLDFCPGGALAVPGGDAVVPVLNRYLALFRKRGAPIFASRDWHPVDSAHFQEQGGSWPVHCVQQSRGAHFHPELRLPEETVVISKGTTRTDEGYSALRGVADDGTPLPVLLRRLELNRLYVGGLATDYCVKQSVLDGLRQGWPVTVLSDAVRAVDLKLGDGERAIEEMLAAGAGLATLETIESCFCAERQGLGTGG